MKKSKAPSFILEFRRKQKRHYETDKSIFVCQKCGAKLDVKICEEFRIYSIGDSHRKCGGKLRYGKTYYIEYGDYETRLKKQFYKK